MLSVGTLLLLNFLHEVINPDCRKTILFFFVLALTMFINCASVKWATRIQDTFTFGKLIALAILIVIGLIEIGSGENFIWNCRLSSTVKHLYSWRPDTKSPTANLILGRCDGFMVSMLVSGLSGPGLRPGCGHCILFLGKTLDAYCLAPWVPVNLIMEITLWWTNIPSTGE